MDYDSYLKYISRYNNWLTEMYSLCDKFDNLTIVGIIDSEHVQRYLNSGY